LTGLVKISLSSLDTTSTKIIKISVTKQPPQNKLHYLVFVTDIYYICCMKQKIKFLFKYIADFRLRAIEKKTAKFFYKIRNGEKL